MAGNPISPINVNLDVDKSLGKIDRMLRFIFGPKWIRENAKAQAEARLLAVDTAIKERGLLLAAAIEEKKTVLKGEHEIRALEEELAAKALPPPEEDDLIIDCMLEDPEPEEIVVHSGRINPFENVAQMRFKNTKNVLNETIKALPEHKDVSDEDPEPDWVARFFDGIKDVSNTHMQKIWGRLLAGEVARPGKFSLRALDALKNLTPAEAKLFERYSRLCTADKDAELVVFDQQDADERGIDAGELTSLVECGLFHHFREFSKDFKPPVIFNFGSKSVHVTAPKRHASSSPRIWLHGFTHNLTSIGKELRSLVQPEPDEVFLRGLCAAVARRGGLEGQIVDTPPGSTPEEEAPKPSAYSPSSTIQ